MVKYELRCLPFRFYWAFVVALVLSGVLTFRTFLMYFSWDEGEQFIAYRHFFTHLVNYLTWAILLPLVAFWAEWISSEAEGKIRKLMVYCLVLCIINECITYLLYFPTVHFLGLEPFDKANFARLLKGTFVAGLILRIIEFWVLLGLFLAVNYIKKYRHKEIELANVNRQLTDAKLDALRMQLHPHFLFNTLNTVSSLMDIDTHQAQKVVAKLGNLLRNIFEKDDALLISLKDEIRFVQNYLDIEQMRFHDRLQIQYHIEPAAYQVQLPKLLLQPLAENAIKHGFSKEPNSLIIITIKAITTANSLEIVVTDNGNGLSDHAKVWQGTGIGLKNTQQRLQEIYGQRATMTLCEGISKGFGIKISIPLS